MISIIYNMWRWRWWRIFGVIIWHEKAIFTFIIIRINFECISNWHQTIQTMPIGMRFECRNIFMSFGINNRFANKSNDWIWIDIFRSNFISNAYAMLQNSWKIFDRMHWTYIAPGLQKQMKKKLLKCLSRNF